MPLPILATVSRAYSFVFENFGLIYRLCWFPMVLAYSPGLLGAFVARDDGEAISLSMGQLVGGLAFAAVFLIASIYFMSMAVVAVHRLILFNDRQPGRTFVFSAGPAEFLFTVIPLAIFLVVAVLAFAVYAAESLHADGGRPVLLPFLLISGSAVAGIWLTCRFVALYPLIVMTERLAISEAWQLSRGSFWRIAGVFFLASLPLTVANAAISGIGASITHIPPHMEGAIAATAFATITKLAIEIVVSIPTLAVWVSVLCFCTKALGGLAPDETVSPPPGSG